VPIPNRYFPVVFCLAALLFAATDACASHLAIPPDARQAIRLMYSGQPGQATDLAKKVEAERPDHPLGYLIEADILWWKIYCRWSERKYNTIDAWPHPRPAEPDDTAEVALADKVIHLAEAAIARSDTAEMELYAGLGYALRARSLGIRYDRNPAARAAVAARSHLLRCIELDPDMPDAYLGLGLYNYFVDTLSALARIMRFFMGIPGGDKREGLRQLEIASTKGELTPMEARFFMAKSLRNYDREYARAIQAAAPLVTEYPGNGLFLILVGDLEQKLGHTEEAAKEYRAAAAASSDNAECEAKMRKLAREALEILNASPKPP
jgi:tetratricopeptide (TPR) repeat protein